MKKGTGGQTHSRGSFRKVKTVKVKKEKRGRPMKIKLKTIIKGKDRPKILKNINLTFDMNYLFVPIPIPFDK